MKEELNNICYEYMGRKFNVPMAAPWETYFGVTHEAEGYEDKIDSSLGEPFYVFHLTERCNMRCRYCFEGNKGERDMSMDTVNQFIQYVERCGFKSFTIRFFGGEPSLRVDFLEQILEQFAVTFPREDGYDIHYNLFTNAVYLPDKLIDLIKKYNIGCLVSVDGCQEMHDRNRVFPNGEGSYGIVIKNVMRLQKEINKNIILHAVYDTAGNDISFIDIAEECNKNGFNNISIEVPWVSSDSDMVLNQKKAEQFRNNMEEYAVECVRRLRKCDFSLLTLHEINRTLLKIIFHQATLYTDACCAGKVGFAVSTEGDLYPCHTFVNDPEYAMGSLKNGIVNQALKDKFDSLNCETIESCKDCAIRYYCGKRCYADSYCYAKDITKMNPYRCDVEKEFFKAAMYIYSEIREDLEVILRMRKLAFKQLDMSGNV